MDFLDSTLERMQAIRHGGTPGSYIKQRVAESAENLSRAGNLAARCEIINEAVTKFAHLLYIADTDGAFANIDPVTYRILIPAPWGSTGWKRWGLRAWEARALRAKLITRSKTTKPRPPLFDYDMSTRTWHLNGGAWGAFEAARHYLQREAMTVAELRAITMLEARQSATRVQRHRIKRNDER